MEKSWERFYRLRGRFYLLPHPQIGKIIAKFNVYRVKKILDLGCGSGRHCIKLAKSGFKVTGIDFSKEAIKLAKKWAKREKLKITFKIGDIHKTFQYKNNSFNGILAIDSIHYETVQSLNFTLIEAKRVLKKGGIIFVTIPTQIGNPLVTHLIFSKEETKEMISKHFKIIDSFMDKSKFLCVFGIKE